MASNKPKLPPQSIESEQSVLGALLIDQNAIIRIADVLNEEHLYRSAHKKIYSAILALYDRREPADVVTVSGELSQRGELEEIGGESYLAELVNSVPTAANIESYAKIVRDVALRRTMLGIATSINEQAYGSEKSVEELLNEVEQEIFAMSQAHLVRHFVPIRETLMASFDRLEDLHKNASGVRGVPTGFRDIDNKLSGLQDSNLIILAARPSMGKTSLALNISQYVSVHQQIPVGFFSLESSREELVDRLLASQSGVDYWKITTGNLSEEDFGKVGESMGVLAEAPLFIDDTPGASMMEMRTKARRLQAEHGVKLIVVDYLQLAISRNLINRVQEVSEISQGLKNIARELHCPVLALSQLSRQVEQRGENRPQLSDLRDSGCLSGDSRVQLADGRRVPIRDLVTDAKTVQILALDPVTLKLISVKGHKAWKTGRKKVYRLVTQLGREIKATANHQFKTFTGWHRLDELRTGEYLALPRVLHQPESVQQLKTTMSLSEVALLGHLIGDGCTLPRHALQYTTNNRGLADEVVRLASTVFGAKINLKVKKERNWWQVYLSATQKLAPGKRNPVAVWLDELGVWGLRSHEKFIPSVLFTQDNERVALFLKHLWSTDGCLGVFGKKGPRPLAYYASSSQHLAVDVQTLLLRLGVIARIRSVSQGTKGRTQWHVIVTGKSDLEKFVDQVGVVGPKQSRLLDIVDYYRHRTESTNRDVIPSAVWRSLVKSAHQKAGLTQRALHALLGQKYNGTALYKSGLSRNRALKIGELLDCQELKDLAVSDIYWDRIVEIKELGEEDVFDLEVPGVHNFVSENMIVHNSIEQDADVVMFLWKPDEDEKDRPDHVKLTIAKHRNGPTGEIDLVFRGEAARFYSMEKKRDN